MTDTLPWFRARLEDIEARQALSSLAALETWEEPTLVLSEARSSELRALAVRAE